MRWLIALLLVLLLALQYTLWFGKGGYADVRRLRAEIELQRAENARLAARNRALQAEIDDLKQGLDAVEGQAREDLGMLREGETFFRVVPAPAPKDD
ncbi:MAG: cell division protein FtsB [Gammaproteobacteria bacterium]|nr:MAG: cell division protein FtsB [Gammaproteobacteria bacterium]